MSFQNFRLGEQHPLLQQPSAVHPDSSLSSKQPYGSGDTDDGYTLVFPNLDAFQAWRADEEERKCVEFVKGDTHGSKADPPRFKDHTKLVCARHSRSGRKKYVKKHPERVRKVPSRKLDGQGCQASISYKTYFDSEEVRACYISQHSHEIGFANLPFTRRGRKAAVQQEKERVRNKSATTPEHDHQMPSLTTGAALSVQTSSAQPASSSFNSAISMLAPLPEAAFASPAPSQPFGFSVMPSFNPSSVQVQGQQQSLLQERWDNMATLFPTVREHARTFEYPAASVAALESVLVRLYLESPMGLSPPQNIVQGGMSGISRNQTTSAVHSNAHQSMNMNGNIDQTNLSNAEGA